MSPDALAALVRGSLAGTPLGLRLEAEMRQQEAGRLYAQADRAEHDERVRAALDAAVARVDAADDREDALEAALPAAIGAERAAEDRARSAAEHARVTAAEEAEASEAGTALPEELTALIVRKDAGAVVAARERAAAEGATAARVQAEGELTAARADALARRRELAAAEELAEDPDPVVARSDSTLIGDWAALLAAGDLTAAELPRVRALVLRYARASGADAVLRGEARRKLEQEERERASLTPLSRAGDRRALIALPLPAGPAR
jgi:hypothetical protein